MMAHVTKTPWKYTFYGIFPRVYRHVRVDSIPIGILTFARTYYIYKVY